MWYESLKLCITNYTPLTLCAFVMMIEVVFSPGIYQHSSFKHFNFNLKFSWALLKIVINTKCTWNWYFVKFEHNTLFLTCISHLCRGQETTNKTCKNKNVRSLLLNLMQKLAL